MDVTKVDAAICDTVVKALKRGKYELEGDEILAFAQAFAWVAELKARIENAVAAQKAAPAAAIAPPAAPAPPAAAETPPPGKMKGMVVDRPTRRKP